VDINKQLICCSTSASMLMRDVAHCTALKGDHERIVEQLIKKDPGFWVRAGGYNNATKLLQLEVTSKW
jgi:hypothetical protein